MGNIETEYCSCDFCESNHLQTLFSSRDWKYNIEGQFTLCKCVDCGLVFVNPRPTKNTIKNFYPEQYSPHNRANKEYTNRMGGLARKIIFGPDALTGTFGEQLYNWVTFRVFVHPPESGKKILDIGCGAGEYLNIWKSLGWEIEGVEPNPLVARQTAEKLEAKIHIGDAESINLPHKSYDVVTMSHVLEHTYSPSIALSNICNMLKDEGKLLVMVPNFDSLDRKIFKSNWAALELPRHLYQFTPKTLTTMMEKAGFQVAHLGHSLYSSDLTRSIRKSLHFNSEIHPAQLERLLGSLLLVIPSLLKMSTTMWCVAVKRK